MQPTTRTSRRRRKRSLQKRLRFRNPFLSRWRFPTRGGRIDRKRHRTIDTARGLFRVWGLGGWGCGGTRCVTDLLGPRCIHNGNRETRDKTQTAVANKNDLKVIPQTKPPFSRVSFVFAVVSAPRFPPPLHPLPARANLPVHRRPRSPPNFLTI
jgi:hypothetical protein